MAWEWSEEKLRLFRFEHDTVVSASAGTGKTTALVELMRRLLAGETSYPAPVELANILAITFTNKAAAELRQRLHAGLAEAAEAAVGERLQEANIHTFHGFCAQLLAPHAYDIGLLPGFRVSEPLEAKRLAERGIWRMMREAARHEDASLQRLARAYPLDMLARLIRDVMDKMAGRAVERPDLETEVARLDAEALRPAYAALETAMHALRAAPDALKPAQAEKGRTAAELLIAPFLSHAHAGTLPGPRSDAAQAWAFFEETDRVYAAGKTARIWPHALIPARDAYKAAVDQVRGVLADIHALPDQLALLDLVLLARRAYENEKRRASVLDFNDLENRAIALLREHDEVRAAMTKRLHVILVDESQDTNPVQLELLSLLRREADNAWGLPPNRFLFVGDRKQSIYRFRGADLSAFRTLEATGRDRGLEPLHFRENFRSRPELLAFFNGLFARVFAETQDAEDLGYGSEDDLAPKPGAESGAGPLPVEWLRLVPGAKRLGIGERRLAEARWIALRLRALTAFDAAPCVREGAGYRRARFGDCAILLRRFTHVRAYEQALREAGISYTVARSSGLYERREVRDLLHLARTVLNPLDAFSRLSFLRSPAVLLSDSALLWLAAQPDATWALPDSERRARFSVLAQAMPVAQERERAALDEAVRLLGIWQARLPLCPPSEFLEGVLEAFDLRALAAAGPDATRVRANQRKLVEVARRFEAAEPGLMLADFLARLEDVQRLEERESEGAPEANEQAVTISTIHQAKGLEYPIVIVPDLQAGPLPHRGDWELSRSGRLALRAYDDALAERLESATMATLRHTEARAEAAEYRRLLYVALTRARDYLILIGERPKSSASEREENAFAWISRYIEEAALSPARDEEQPLEAFLTALTPCEADASLPAEFPPSEPRDRHVPASHHFGTMSVTALRDLAFCERRFLLRRLMDRATLLWMDDTDERFELSEEAPDARTRGLLIHRFLQEQTASDGHLSAAAFRSFAALQAAPPEAAWVEAMATRLEAVGSFPPEWAPLDAAKIAREWPFLAELRLPHGHTVRLKGRVDAVAIFPDGRFALVDYKLSRRASRPDDVRQIALYAAVLRAHLGTAQGHRAAIGYLFAGAEAWRSVDIGEERLNAELARLEADLVRALSDAEKPLADWPRPIVCPAPDCPYREFCER